MTFEEELESLERQGLLRGLRPLAVPGGKISKDGKTALNFSSNDYLDLSSHPDVKAASAAAVERLGCGATASRLMSGHLELHEQLEDDLALMTGMDAALVFGSGFLANLGVLTALAGRGDAVFWDRLNHASLVDGARLSGAKHFRFRHKDLGHLEELLKNSGVSGRRVIVSDSVFSMDGDIADLAGLHSLTRRYDALLVVDEAHAIGVFGPDGGGVWRTLPGDVRPDIVQGTMSKALGGYGGFAACSKAAREYLINRARTFIYSTGLPPACLASARAAIEVIRREGDMGDRLLGNAAYMRDLLVEAGFDVPPMESQIIPLHVGDNQKALDFSRVLWDEGVLATAVRPPTVPAGTARLRLSITLAHAREDLRAAVDTIADVARKTEVL